MNINLEQIILRAYLRRAMRTSYDWHPAKAQVLATRFKCINARLDAIARESIERWRHVMIVVGRYLK